MLLQTIRPWFPNCRSGKVRDSVVFPDGELILLVATDRISIFDVVLPTLIPRKGEVLTQMTLFWDEVLKDIIATHLVTSEDEKIFQMVRDAFPDVFSTRVLPEVLRGRSMIVRKLKPFPVEAIVRGYLTGSGWKSYCTTREVCGERLPKGLKDGSCLHYPIFTPTTKAETGHDENMTFTQLCDAIGTKAAHDIRELSLYLYEEVSQNALEKGIILADTKLEFGQDEKGNIFLIDEYFTPDSSRFWRQSTWIPGECQESFDKQPVRDYGSSIGWNKKYPGPELPEDVVTATTKRYLECFRVLTGRNL